MEADPAFRDAFERLTPGRQRGYLLHFNDAKQPATRAARIERVQDPIMERSESTTERRPDADHRGGRPSYREARRQAR
jgi:uncharacterized protein YdeI (YjbR/CyaY-like superfamily)